MCFFSKIPRMVALFLRKMNGTQKIRDLGESDFESSRFCALLPSSGS